MRLTSGLMTKFNKQQNAMNESAADVQILVISIAVCFITEISNHIFDLKSFSLIQT